MSLFEELKRRNVIRVGIAYVVVAWLVAQVAALRSSASVIALFINNIEAMAGWTNKCTLSTTETILSELIPELMIKIFI